MSTDNYDFIVWDSENKKILFVSGIINKEKEENHKCLENAFCINVHILDNKHRYGQWFEYDSYSATCNNWRKLSKENFPKEFLTNLLLLGLDNES